MFDGIPVRVWLLIAIAATAYAPLRYVYRHITHSPQRRDITLPPEDLSWRTSNGLIRNLAIITGLGGLATFIFTPAAEQFAQSPAFLPILMFGFSAFAFSTVVDGYLKGRVQPLVKGWSNHYERETQPKRFWASLGWNMAFGCLFVWLAFATVAQGREDRCYYSRTADTPQQQLSACNELLGRSDNTEEDRAAILAARGTAYYRLGDYENALADYDQAIVLNPKDSHSLYNRGLVYEKLDDAGSAIVAYTESLEARPDNADAYLRRGEILLDRARYDEAVADFTHAHELQPRDPWALAERGLTYAWNGKRALAERDFRAVKEIDPSNQTLLRGEALLSMNAGKFRPAVDRLTEALRQDPEDVWSLDMRAEAYRQLGEKEKARADNDRLLKLETKRPEEVGN